MNIQDLKNIPHSINLTASAKEQLKVIINNDFTLEGFQLRINIKGKECDGFTYGISFDREQKDDTKIKFEGTSDLNIEILLDPFTSKFVRKGTLDFLQNRQIEGFTFYNEHESFFNGKFFKDLKFEDI